MLCELEQWPRSSFVTLTYDDEHMPGDGTLFPYDTELWLKRVRRAIEPRRIRYYLAGEYGDRTKRPHYHAVLFGVDPSESGVVDDAWGLGWTKVGTVTEHSIRYVADYVTYKVFGVAAERVYERRKPPFARMSQGLGRDWCDARADQLRVALSMEHRGHPVALPRYFARRLGITWWDSKEVRWQHDAEVIAEHLKRDPSQKGKGPWCDWETVREANAQNGRDARAKRALYFGSRPL